MEKVVSDGGQSALNPAVCLHWWSPCVMQILSLHPLSQCMVQAVCLHWLSQECEPWNLPFSLCLPHFQWGLRTNSKTLAFGASPWPSSAQPSDKALTVRLCLPELRWLSPRYNAVCLHWLTQFMM